MMKRSHAKARTANVPASLGAAEHIGMALRRARLRHELSLTDVSEALHLQPAYLSALEALDKSALPSLGHALGFVRSYAKLVGLEPQEAVDRYRVESEIPRDLGISPLPHHVIVRKIRLPRGAVSGLAVMIAAVCAAGWYGLNAEAEPLSAGPAASTAIAAQTSISTDPSILTLKATGASWVEVRDAAGVVILSRVMIPGETFEGSAKAGLSLSARNAGLIELYHGGVSLGTLGQNGEIIDNQPLRGRRDSALLPELAIAASTATP